MGNMNNSKTQSYEKSRNVKNRFMIFSKNEKLDLGGFTENVLFVLLRIAQWVLLRLTVKFAENVLMTFLINFENYEK